MYYILRNLCDFDLKNAILIITVALAALLVSCGKSPDSDEVQAHPENDIPIITAAEATEPTENIKGDITATEQPETSAATAVSKSETVKTSAKATVTAKETVTENTTVSEENNDGSNTVDSGEAVEDIDRFQSVQPTQLSEEEICRNELLKYYYEALEEYSEIEFGGSYYDDEGNLHILVTDESLIPAETAEGLIYEAVTYSYAKLREYQNIIAENRTAIGFTACGIDQSANKVVIYCGDPLDTDLLYSLVPEDAVKIVDENSDASDL